jgi:hypothetical protein
MFVQFVRRFLNWNIASYKVPRKATTLTLHMRKLMRFATLLGSLCTFRLYEKGLNGTYCSWFHWGALFPEEPPYPVLSHSPDLSPRRAVHISYRLTSTCGGFWRSIFCDRVPRSVETVRWNITHELHSISRSALFTRCTVQLQPRGSRPPRLYRLPKIPKAGVPLRPIISTVRFPTYILNIYLVNWDHVLVTPHTSWSILSISSARWTHSESYLTTTWSALILSLHEDADWRFLEISKSVVSWEWRHLFHYPLTASSFCFDGHSTNSCHVSPLLHLIVIFFLEDFEEMAHSRAAFKPTCCFRYVADRFVVWSHGPEELRNF